MVGLISKEMFRLFLILFGIVLIASSIASEEKEIWKFRRGFCIALGLILLAIGAYLG